MGQINEMPAMGRQAVFAIVVCSFKVEQLPFSLHQTGSKMCIGIIF